MQTHLTLTFSTLFLTLLFTSPTFLLAHDHDEPQDLVRSSCVHARYPRLCIRTLSNYAGPTNTSLDVARAALRVSLAHALRASKYLKSYSGPKSTADIITKRQRVALSDCAEQISDSVDELRKSLEELQHLRPETFRWQMSNAQTWVSAALTDGDTCLDGFSGEGKVRRDLKRRVTDVARVTSNALYMINRLCEGGSGKVKPSSSNSKN
ncbi:pectinesterase inhibitor 3-like [Gastrolobium bilobum]|uniref:pectinesterase inhibitor 3-like n=1 Tax=Gastrolobium bilobum TaxID=150636 RepID=UPI002AB19208|nr:pectinesterase inhibitor 3-like [Gastrolobium bilobum]